MIDILVRGDIVFTGSEVLRDAYVYIRDGRVESIGSGLPPEEATYASLLLGGPRRAVLPAIPWPVDPLGYLAKTPRCEPPSISCETRQKAYSDMRILLPAVMEAHIHGIGVPLLVSPSPSHVASLAEAVGGEYGALVPEECGPIASHPSLQAVARPTGWETVCPAASLCRAGDPYERSLELARSTGLPEPSIREGGKARIAVFSLESPPLLGTTVRSVDDARTIYSLGATVESLLIGEDILVEIGEHLMITEKHVREALRLAEKLWGPGSEIEGDITG